jgi:hypothetical protein
MRFERQMKDAQLRAPGAYFQKARPVRVIRSLFLYGSSTPQEEEHRKKREKRQAHQREAYTLWRNERQAFVQTKGEKLEGEK